MSTPTVVTVRTVHLYWIRIAFHRPTRGDVRSPRAPGRRATKPQEYLNLPNHTTRNGATEGTYATLTLWIG